MSRTLTLQLASALGGPDALFAQIAAKRPDEYAIGAAIVLTLAGMAMHWHLPRHRMSMEERVKDGKISVERARRRLRFYGWCAPLATLAGVAVLVLVLLDVTQ